MRDDLHSLWNRYIGAGVRDEKLELEIAKGLKRINLQISPEPIPDFEFAQKFVDLCYSQLSENTYRYNPTSEAFRESIFLICIKRKCKKYVVGKKILSPEDHNIPFSVEKDLQTISRDNFVYWFRFYHIHLIGNNFTLRLSVKGELVEFDIRNNEFDDEEFDEETYYQGEITKDQLFRLENIERLFKNLRHPGLMGFNSHSELGDALPFTHLISDLEKEEEEEENE
jgi:hypothetical protein